MEEIYRYPNLSSSFPRETIIYHSFIIYLLKYKRGHIYLHAEFDMANYGGDIGEHLIVGEVKISGEIVVPDVHGVDGVPESIAVDRRPLTCITSHNKQPSRYCNGFPFRRRD